jgi:hypothetical protein
MRRRLAITPVAAAPVVCTGTLTGVSDRILSTSSPGGSRRGARLAARIPDSVPRVDRVHLYPTSPALGRRAERAAAFIAPTAPHAHTRCLRAEATPQVALTAALAVFTIATEGIARPAACLARPATASVPRPPASARWCSY